MSSLPKNKYITRINLNGQALTEIPKEVFSYKHLRKLFLRNNKIKNLPKEINNLKQLTVLDISNNILTSMHAKIFDLKKLEVLILNNNKIKSIPSQIKNLKSLRILGLANNKLTTLNVNLSYLNELKELNLSGNGFHEFPQEIEYMKNLVKLWLCNYDFYIPELKNLKSDLPHLEKIYISNVLKNQKTTFNSMLSNQTMNNPEIKEVSIKNPAKKKIFISYSQQDKEWLKRVKKHIKVLSLYNTDSDFELWDDERISSGKDWKKEINNALSESTAAILLISTDFLGSDFIKNNELQPLLEKAEKEGTLILPLILSPCRFLKISGLNKFQAINNPETQILTQLSQHDQDVILEKLTDDVERYINPNS